MSKKPTGLAAFTAKQASETVAADAIPARTGARRRGEGETVALTVRLSKGDWMRLHQLAMSEGVSLQTLAVTGFSKVLAEHGLDPIAS